jgi:hypothetical protein
MLLGLLWIGVDMTFSMEKEKSNAELQASMRTEYPPSCMPAFAPSPSLIAQREIQWRIPSRVETLRRRLNGKWVHMMGDSTMRDIFYQFILLLEGSEELGKVIVDPVLIEQRLAIRHKPQQHDIISAQGRVQISFHWAPFTQNATRSLSSFLVSPSSAVVSPDIIILSAGFWDLLRAGPESREERIERFGETGLYLARRALEAGWVLRPLPFVRG